MADEERCAECQHKRIAHEPRGCAVGIRQVGLGSIVACWCPGYQAAPPTLKEGQRDDEEGETDGPRMPAVRIPVFDIDAERGDRAMGLAVRQLRRCGDADSSRPADPRGEPRWN